LPDTLVFHVRFPKKNSPPNPGHASFVKRMNSFSAWCDDTLANVAWLCKSFIAISTGQSASEAVPTRRLVRPPAAEEVLRSFEADDGCVIALETEELMEESNDGVETLLDAPVLTDDTDDLLLLVATEPKGP
jgi:hypothetical protein